MDLYDTGDVDERIANEEREARFGSWLVKRLSLSYGYNVCFLFVRLRSLRES